MAHIVLKSGSAAGQVFQLRLGNNRFGRNPENDFTVEHPTVSSHHCEIVLGDNRLTLRDLGSTNGTFLNGAPIKEVELQAGQTFALGEVEFFVESTEVKVAIPKFAPADLPSPPVVLPGGGMLCPRHLEATVTHQCSFCKEVMCDECVHRLRRKGGKTLKLCPLCSHAVFPLTKEEKKKRSFLGFLQQTVKMPFLRRGKDD